jgi:carbonic anhydrase
MNRMIRFSLFAIIIFLASCTNETKNNQEATATKQPVAGIAETYLTAEKQAQLTPDDVIRSLKEGNKHFVDNSLTLRNFTEQIRSSIIGQFPEAVILSCIDSRIPVVYVFDKGIGDLFVIRVAGSVVNEDILGCMEYGCKVSGAKIILVIGHGSCGAIKSAIDNVKMGNITQMLEKVKPAIEKSSVYKGEKSSKNYDFVNLVCLNNVLNSIDEIKARSPILKEMSDNGKIKIVGAIYDLNTGIVKFLE